MNNGDLPAAPISTTQLDDGTVFEVSEIGLTKREYFAAMAMQGLLANSFYDGVTMPISHALDNQIAEMAVNQADCLVAALEEQ